MDLFIRSGNRILEMTEPARRIVAIASLVFRELDDIKAVAGEFREGSTGRLNVAATFTFARDILPDALRRFVARYPRVDRTCCRAARRRCRGWLPRAKPTSL